MKGVEVNILARVLSQSKASSVCFWTGCYDQIFKALLNILYLSIRNLK